MKNFDLNVGGFIGAFLGLGIGILILVMAANDPNENRRYRLPIFLLIGGAAGGNFLWSKIFKKDE